MEHYVFVSYARDDVSYTTELVKMLRSKGIPVWFDDTIERGGRWAQELEMRINACAAFIVVMSPSAASSDWVSREIDQAELRHRPIFPVLLAGERFFRLSDRQFDDVRTRAMPSDAFVERLRERVESYRPWIRLMFCVNCRQQFYWDNPRHCSYHPLEPVTYGNTGPREDYRDVWKYPCCGQVLLTAIDDSGRDLPPPRSPGCARCPSIRALGIANRSHLRHGRAQVLAATALT